MSIGCTDLAVGIKTHLDRRNSLHCILHCRKNSNINYINPSLARVFEIPFLPSLWLFVVILLGSSFYQPGCFIESVGARGHIPTWSHYRLDTAYPRKAGSSLLPRCFRNPAAKRAMGMSPLGVSLAQSALYPAPA